MGEEYQEIYALDDPRTQVVRYVGISNNALRRYKQHIAASHSLRLQAWNASLEKFQLAPGVTVIDEAATRAEGLDKEAFWIQWFLRHGAQLLNEQRPSLSAERTAEIFEGLAPSHWRNLDRSMGEIAQAIISGHHENLSYKELASVEWRLFNMADYEAIMTCGHNRRYEAIVGHSRDRRNELDKEGLERFGVPICETSSCS